MVLKRSINFRFTEPKKTQNNIIDRNDVKRLNLVPFSLGRNDQKSYFDCS